MCSEDVTDNEAKFYRIASFTNSDGEPFGLTIKGKGKHVDAHNKLTSKRQSNNFGKRTTYSDRQG